MPHNGSKRLQNLCKPRPLVAAQLNVYFSSQAMVGAQCCPPTSRGKPSPAEELRAYRVLGVIDKVSTPKEDNGPAPF